jgi:hypothetical protein
VNAGSLVKCRARVCGFLLCLDRVQAVARAQGRRLQHLPECLLRACLRRFIGAECHAYSGILANVVFCIPVTQSVSKTGNRKNGKFAFNLRSFI